MRLKALTEEKEMEEKKREAAEKVALVQKAKEEEKEVLVAKEKALAGEKKAMKKGVPTINNLISIKVAH